MTTQIEAMKLSLAAHREIINAAREHAPQKTVEAVKALRAAIEAAEKVEPDTIVHNTDTPGHFAIITPAMPAGSKLYLHPPAAEIESLRKDAERYSYLRTPNVGHHKVMFWMNEPAMYVDLSWNELDYAIDVAMQEKQP